MRQSSTIGMVAVAVTCAALSGAPARPDATAEAEAASRAWLAIVDGGCFEEGRERCAAYLKAVALKDRFVPALAAARTPLGAGHAAS